MKGFLRYIDRRLLAAIVLVLLAVVALRVVWVGSYAGSLRTASAEKAEKEKELDDLQGRIVTIKSSGVQGGEQLLNRVARLEALVLPANDVLAVSANLIALSERSGVVLEGFTRVDGGEGAKEETAARVLRGARFSFSVTGDFESVTRFLESVVASDRFVATIDSFSLLPVGQDGSMFGLEVRVEGEFLLWTLIEKTLTSPVVAATPVSPGSPSGQVSPPAGVPTTVPSTVTTLPAPATSVAAPPTTVPGRDRLFDSCEEAADAGFGPYEQGVDPEFEHYASVDPEDVFETEQYKSVGGVVTDEIEIVRIACSFGN